MKIFNSKRFRIVALLLIVGVLITQTNILSNIFRPASAYAVGDLTVTWNGAGSGNTGPMFSTDNMAPGDTEQKTITVENGSADSHEISIRGLVTANTGDLSDVMTIVISRNGSDIYGGSLGIKTLTEFFTDSSGGNGIILGTLGSGETASYDLFVTFLEESGNQYQSQALTFDLKIGLVFEVPEICASIENLNIESPIYGTQRSDILRGTSGNDLIYGLEGSDYIDGRGGNDCIIAGAGSDYVLAGGGNDLVYGDGGSDYISGGSGADRIFGGAGSDALFGNSGDDVLSGDAGQDAAFGGAGSDTCTANFTLQCEF